MRCGGGNDGGDDDDDDDECSFSVVCVPLRVLLLAAKPVAGLT